ncbi:hypothetical protein GQ55_7G243300 [Panicum hallii var. hallii]|uniref:Uncharacterized protein n=1 Tax=Panicum hallii var. hallii TaxID=1504633 RepID=A0A2T7CYU2_9POAL|nr:hypothetical protein GQ55_7G243300 [Panicum hallii var. hallii]
MVNLRSNRAGKEKKRLLLASSITVRICCRGAASQVDPVRMMYCYISSSWGHGHGGHRRQASCPRTVAGGSDGTPTNRAPPDDGHCGAAAIATDGLLQRISRDGRKQKKNEKKAA